MGNSVEKPANDPPKPPTLDEALTMLSELRGAMRTGFYGDTGRRTDELLERALKSGMYN